MPRKKTPDTRLRMIGVSRTLERGPVGVWFAPSSGLAFVTELYAPTDTLGDPMGLREAPSGTQLVAAILEPGHRFHHSITSVRKKTAADIPEYDPHFKQVASNNRKAGPAMKTRKINERASLVLDKVPGVPEGYDVVLVKKAKPAATKTAETAAFKPANGNKLALDKARCTYADVEAFFSRNKTLRDAVDRGDSVLVEITNDITCSVPDKISGFVVLPVADFLRFSPGDYDGDLWDNLLASDKARLRGVEHEPALNGRPTGRVVYGPAKLVGKSMR